MKFQSIVRSFHNRENPYVQINKKALLDNSISMAARCLWAICMSRPDDWDFRVTELARVCNVNVQTIQRYIKELIEHKYAVGFVLKNKLNNQFVGNYYVFFEFQASKEEIDRCVEGVQKKFPHMAFPCTAFPCTENTLLLNNEEELKKEKRVKTNNPLPLSEKGKDCSVVKNKFLNQENMKEKPSERDIHYTRPNGSKGMITASQVFAAFSKSNWKTEQIIEAMEIASNAAYMRDPIRYIEGIMEKKKNPIVKIQKTGLKYPGLPNHTGEPRWRIRSPRFQGQSSTGWDADIGTPALQN